MVRSSGGRGHLFRHVQEPFQGRFRPFPWPSNVPLPRVQPTESQQVMGGADHQTLLVDLPAAHMPTLAQARRSSCSTRRSLPHSSGSAARYSASCAFSGAPCVGPRQPQYHCGSSRDGWAPAEPPHHSLPERGGPAQRNRPCRPPACAVSARDAASSASPSPAPSPARPSRSPHWWRSPPPALCGSPDLRLVVRLAAYRNFREERPLSFFPQPSHPGTAATSFSSNLLVLV
jgi:hypothetical protein